MDILSTLLIAIVGIVAGVSIAFAVRTIISKRTMKASITEAERIKDDAAREARRLVDRGREDAREARRDAEREVRDRRKEIQRAESRISNREETVEKRQESAQ